MRKIKAFVYALMGFMLCWNAFEKGHYAITIATGVFTLCAIATTLAAIGTRQITWDDHGITIRKFPASAKEISWAQLEKMRVDHLGYHIRSKQATFKISTQNMSKDLLEKIRTSIRQNHA